MFWCVWKYFSTALVTLVAETATFNFSALSIDIYYIFGTSRDNANNDM